MRPKIRLYNLLEEEFNTELFDSMAACGMPDIAHLLHNDPDLINIGGRHIPFRRIETPGTTWIAYLNSNRQVPRKRIRVILLAFFSAQTECFELRESSWTQFKDKCIAYRGGENYGYTIWQYKGVKEKNSNPSGHAELPGKAGGCNMSQRQDVALRCFRGKSSSLCSGISPENLALCDSIRPSRPMFGTTAGTEY